MKPLSACVLACFLSTGISAGAVRKHALVIGINGYGLQYADRDANDFADFIRSPQGGAFQRSSVTLLTNGSADRDSIIQAIVSLGRDVDQDLASHPNDRTLVYIYVSGHSKVDESTEEAYFMPAGSNPSIAATGIRSDDFLKMVKTYIRADHVIYFLDTCHAASSQNEGSTSKDYERGFQAVLDDKWTKYFQTAKERHMGLFSSAASQKSYEDPELRHGIFTHYLLKGLRGEADRPPVGDGDGTVTSDELKNYLAKYVPMRAKTQGKQTPIASLVWDGDLPFSTVPKDVNLGLYSEDAPYWLVQRVREMITAGETILSIAVGPDDTWTAVSNKNYWTTVAGFGDLFQEHIKTEPAGTRLNLTAIGGAGSHLMIFGANGYMNHEAPGAVLKAINELREKKSVIEQIQFDSSGHYLIIFDKYGYMSSGMPENLLRKLSDVNSAKQTITNATLGPEGSWVITYGESSWWAYGVRQSLIETLWSVWERKAAVSALGIHPKTGAWILVAK